MTPPNTANKPLETSAPLDPRAAMAATGRGQVEDVLGFDAEESALRAAARESEMEV